jgi:PPOX class probable F420-dependent enzyme
MSMAVIFDESTRTLLDGKNFATVATLNPDGGPQASVVWFRRADDQRAGDVIEFSVTVDKRKARNLLRDPRISVTVYDTANPYQSVEIRGVAELVEDQAKELPLALSQRYLGADPPPEPDEVKRLIVRVIPERVNAFSPPAQS